MTLLDEARSLSSVTGGRCGVGVLMESLSPGEGAELVEALSEPSVQSTALHKALKARGHHVSVDALQRHRRGDCRCPL